MKHILVTGASGFLGKYLLAELAQTDVQVVAISRHPKRSDSPKLKWVQADISDEASLLRPELLEELKDIDVVIHA
ncbi:MAG: NAD(P)-dependent oxidoreductase, partial [Proteobacteria bacterium]